MSEGKQPQSKTTMIIVCLLAGNLGIHRFMMGYTGIGVLMLLTLGCCGILTVILIIQQSHELSSEF